MKTLSVTVRCVVPVVAALAVAGCAAKTVPIAPADHAGRVKSDLAAIFSEQEPITAPITLTEAMARALKYNLDHRLKIMEEAVALRETDVSEMALLPQVVASAGYDARSNYDASVSRNLSDGSVGIEPTTSDERASGSADLTLTWNILDFGVGYIRAKQQQDYARIVEERRRQVVNNIAQDVRGAYWRAAAAERVLGRIDPLMEAVRGALADAERLEQGRVGPARTALEYQKRLLESLRQLELIKRQMVQARTELAVLMNMHPTANFSLAGATVDQPLTEPSLPAETDTLELSALFHRSELRGEAYQLRINQQEARVALLRMLPGISLSTGANYSGNAFLENQAWISGGASLTWNLMNLLSGPTGIKLAETREALSEVRRLALSMAVISQTHVARAGFESAVHEFRLARQLADVESRLRAQRAAEQAAARGGTLEAVRAEVDALVAGLRRDLAYADMQAAYGRVFATVGLSPLPDSLPDRDLSTVAQAIEARFREWRKGAVLPPALQAEPETGLATGGVS